jgi:hypothetical protein
MSAGHTINRLSPSVQKGDTALNLPPKNREYFCGGEQSSRRGVAFLRLSDSLPWQPGS